MIEYFKFGNGNQLKRNKRKMKYAESEEEIRQHGNSPGTIDTCIKAFRAGKPVLLVNSNTDSSEVAAEMIIKRLDRLHENDKKRKVK